MFIGYDALFPRCGEGTTIPWNYLRSSVYSTLVLLCHGFGETDYFEDSSHPEMLYTIFMLFLLIANLLMLNMLIAVMADTHQSVTQHKHQLWLLMKTKYVLLMERRFFGLGRSRYKKMNEEGGRAVLETDKLPSRHNKLNQRRFRNIRPTV